MMRTIEFNCRWRKELSHAEVSDDDGPQMSEKCKVDCYGCAVYKGYAFHQTFMSTTFPSLTSTDLDKFAEHLRFTADNLIIMVVDKGELLPEALVVRGRRTDAIKLGLTIVFFTTLVTISVFFAARYGLPAVCPVQQSDQHKLMDKDVSRERTVRNAEGQILHERFIYDHTSNSIMVQIAGNFSGATPVTLFIDIERALVFKAVDGVCLVNSLEDEFEELMSEGLFAADRGVIEFTYEMVKENDRYVSAGEIPHGLVQSISGPVALGMCSGRITYWLDRVEEDLSHVREKREIVCFPVMTCSAHACMAETTCVYRPDRKPAQPAQPDEPDEPLGPYKPDRPARPYGPHEQDEQ